MSRLWEDFREGAGLPGGGDFGTKESNVHALEHPLETLANTGRGMLQTYKGDVGTAESHLRAPGWRNKVEGLEQEIESAVPMYGHQMITAQEQANRGDTSGAIARTAGIGSAVLAPKAIHAGTRELLPRATRLVRAVRTTPEQIAEKAGPGLEASTTQRQGVIRNAIRTADKNTGALYNNLHAADEAANPEGAIDLGHVEGMPEPKATSGRPLTGREQLAANMAAKVMADGMNEQDARAFLKGQGYAPKQVDRIMESATAPGETGGFTLAKARALRRQVGRALSSARNAANPDRVQVAKLNRAYGQITDAMRERAEQLGGGADFDLADAKYKATRQAEQALRPLLDADSPEEFQAKWDELNTVQRNRLNELAREAGLDLERLKTGGKVAGKVLQGANPNIRTDWRERFVKGYLPARLVTAGVLGGAAYLGGRHRNLPPGLREALYMLPMAAGYGGVGFLKPILARAGALEALPELPEPLPRAGFGRVEPTELHAPEELPRASEPLPPPQRITARNRLLPAEGSPEHFGPERQLPPYNGPTRTIERGPARLPGMVQTRVRGLLPERAANEAGPGPVPIVTGQRLALPPGVAKRRKSKWSTR